MESLVVHDDTITQRVRAVYEADHARLWRSLFAFAGSRDVADEAAAEAFAQVLRRGDAVRDVRAWVWRSAFAIAKGELQRQRQRDAKSASGLEVVAAEVAGDDRVADLLARLSSLSPADRELIVLCHVAGWKPGDLATVMGEPAGRIRVRLHRATERARLALEQEQH